MKTLSRDARGKRVAVAVAVALCMAWAEVSLPMKSFGLSISEEKELGRKTLDVIKDHMPLVEDGEVLTYVQSIGKRIVAQIGPTPYQYQFFIVNESVPNAFAIPGGYIFIYRGLMELMKSEGELAGILAHELAHIQARHIHRRMEEGRLLNIASIAGMVAGIFLGKNMTSEAAGALSMGAMAGAATLELKYSRENEEEADQLGFRYLVASGYPPRDMPNGMVRLSEGKYVSNSRVPSYLSTHPGLGERIGYLSDLVEKERKAPQRSPRKAALGDFAMMQAALVADYTDPKVALDRFQVAAQEGESAAIYGLGRLYLRQGNLEEAISHLQKAARLEPMSPLALCTLGSAYYKVGRLPEARRTLESALALDSSASFAHLRLAMVMQEIGQKTEALEHLKQIEDLAPTFPEIDHQLGVVLGQLGRLGLAHYHLGRYYENRRDWKVALFHYSKAKALMKESPERLGELDRLLKEVEKKKNQAQWRQMKR